MVGEIVDSIHLVQERDQWWIFMSTVMNLRIPEGLNFLTIWILLSREWLCSTKLVTLIDLKIFELLINVKFTTQNTQTSPVALRYLPPVLKQWPGGQNFCSCSLTSQNAVRLWRNKLLFWRNMWKCKVVDSRSTRGWQFHSAGIMEW